MIIYVANFINKGSNINGSFGSNKSFLGRLIKKELIIMLPLVFPLIIDLKTIVSGVIIAKEVIKTLKED